MKKYLVSLIMSIIMTMNIVSISVVAEDNDMILFDVTGGGQISFNSSSGKIENYTDGDESADLVIPAQISGVQVSSIASNAFQGSVNLNTVSIPYSVSDIGTSSFAGCINLKTISIEDGRGEDFNTVSLLLDNTVDIEVEIPEEIDITIGDNAFYGCTNLYSAVLSENVVSIGNNAFAGCTSLKELNIPNSVNNISFNTFNNCQSMESIDVYSENAEYSSNNGALYDKDYEKIIYCPAAALGEFDIEDTVTVVGEKAFANCKYLTNVNMPNGIVAIENSAFTQCVSLTKINLPETLENIGDKAFYWCEDLQAVSIPPSVTSIGSDAFEQCSENLTLYVEKGSYAEEYAKENAFPYEDIAEFVPYTSPETIKTKYINGTYLSYDSTTGMITKASEDTTTLVIPKEIDGVEIIGVDDNAFANVTNMTSITIPGNIKSIGKQAFLNCAKLNSVTFEKEAETIYSEDGQVESVSVSGIESIGDNAFRGCESLVSITLPSTVTQISPTAFKKCSKLQEFKTEESAKYACKDGVLMDKEQRTIFIYPEGKKGNSYTIPATVTQIGSYAFSDCTSLKNVTIPVGIRNISANAFNSCTGMVSCTFENGDAFLQEDEEDIIDGLVIEEDAFANCVNLKNIILPSTIASIGCGAFKNDANLEKVVIPSKVSFFGDYKDMSDEDDTTNEDEIVDDEEISDENDIFYNCHNVILYGDTGSLTEKYAQYKDIRFISLNSSGIQILSISREADEEEVNLYVKVYNGRDTDFSQKMYLAIYSTTGALTKLYSCDVLLKSGETKEFIIPVSLNDSDTTAGAFLIDLNTMIPYSNSLKQGLVVDGE